VIGFSYWIFRLGFVGLYSYVTVHWLLSDWIFGLVFVDSDFVNGCWFGLRKWTGLVFALAFLSVVFPFVFYFGSFQVTRNDITR
jgi:hypothetical protein